MAIQATIFFPLRYLIIIFNSFSYLTLNRKEPSHVESCS